MTNKTILQQISPKLTGEELINLGNYINEKGKQAQKDLLKQLIDDWYNGEGETAYFGNHLTKKLRELNN